MVNLTTPWRLIDEDMPYSEMAWLLPEEIRFLASIFLCQKTEDAKICFYPLPHFAPTLLKTKLRLDKLNTAKLLSLTAIEAIRRPAHTNYASEINECLTSRYNLIDSKCFSLSIQPRYWSAISAKDFLLIRGISSLIKSDMLSLHYEFAEEAALQAFIALDASFQLVLRKLQSKQLPNPSSKDAAEWIFKNFHKKYGYHHQMMERYFGEFYDQRIRAIHPSSRFGDSPYPPLMMDDFLDLRDSLPDVFAFLATGIHAPGFLEATRRARKERQNWGKST